MKLLKRLKFVFKYDIGQDFIIYSIPDKNAIQFIKYKDAKKFAESQIQYRPKILVSVEENK